MIILNSAVSNFVILNDQVYSYFAGNNYLGLANHPEVIQASVAATRKYGINFSASRQTTGTSALHLELEALIAAFYKQEDAAVFASGYLSNRIMLQALKNRYTAVFYDELSHPSILDGFPGQVSLNPYPHCDFQALDQLLQESGSEKNLVVTDGIFPLTGEIVPLDRLCETALKHRALVVLDDAHAAGVIGENGRGTAEFFHLEGTENLYRTGTMSKAFGSYGGFIAADRALVRCLRETSSCYQASTALPPSIVAASVAAFQIVRSQPELRKKVQDHAMSIKNQVTEMGYQTRMDPTPIIPLFFDSEAEALDLCAWLKKNAMIAPFVKYPVKMNKFILRITVSALHTQEQTEDLLEVLNVWRNRHGINPH